MVYKNLSFLRQLNEMGSAVYPLESKLKSLLKGMAFVNALSIPTDIGYICEINIHPIGDTNIEDIMDIIADYYECAPNKPDIQEDLSKTWVYSETAQMYTREWYVGNDHKIHCNV